MSPQPPPPVAAPLPDRRRWGPRGWRAGPRWWPPGPAGPRRPRAAWAGLAVLAAVTLSGCEAPTFGTFTPVTKEEMPAYHLYQGLTIAAMVVGAFVWALIFWCVIFYRRRKHEPRDALPKQTRYNFPWEAAYTITPVIMVAGIFAYTIIAENVDDYLAPRPSATINVTAFQWGWEFQYPMPNGHVVTVLPRAAPVPASLGSGDQALRSPVTYPQMVMPVGETTHINLVSQDVVHGFYVPVFEFSRYAQPGVVNRFEFTPTRTGTFGGRCTQFCGLYHAEMQFSVKIVSPSAFQAWLASGGKTFSTQTRKGPAA